MVGVKGEDIFVVIEALVEDEVRRSGGHCGNILGGRGISWSVTEAMEVL